MGITGARTDVDSAARTLVDRLRTVTDRPLAVGLGISTGAQVAEVLTYADGAIVGSRLVTALWARAWRRWPTPATRWPRAPAAPEPPDLPHDPAGAEDWGPHRRVSSTP